MSHTRGLKRKNAFLQSEGKKTTPAVARIMQEIEAERQKKERLEWYLNEVMKEKELLSRFDDASAVPAAVDAFIAQSSCSTSASTSTSTTSSSSSSSTSSVGHTTYVATDYNRWVQSDATTAKVPEPVVVATAASPVGANAEPVESCARCGCQYVDSQRTCRCRNFESVKKRQRCLSRFVRTGHLLEEDTTTNSHNNAITANDVLLSFDLQAFAFVDPSTTTTTSTTSAIGEDILANVSDDDFLRMILDDAEVCTSSSGSLKVTSEPSTFLGEKSQRRRRASFVGAKDGWDAMLGGAGEESYFAAAGATASTAVYGY
jgi:hypothetical protein